MIEPAGPVIVGVDGSPTSLSAVDLAAEEAMGRVAPLVVLHAVGRDEGTEEASRLVAVAVSRARAEHPGLSVDHELATGDPGTVLVNRSRGACLLVMGHRRSRAFGEMPVASAAAKVVGEVEVPLIVHRPLDTTTDVPLPRPVLVGIAELAGSEPLVEFAFAEASLRGAPLVAMHVWSLPEDSVPAGVHPDRDALARAHDDAEDALTEALDRWAEKYPDVVVHRAVRHGLDVAVALGAASRSAQLAVVGSSHRARSSMGSVAQALVRRAGCPVAVVPVLRSRQRRRPPGDDREPWD